MDPVKAYKIASEAAEHGVQSKESEEAIKFLDAYAIGLTDAIQIVSEARDAVAKAEPRMAIPFNGAIQRIKEFIPPKVELPNEQQTPAQA